MSQKNKHSHYQEVIDELQAYIEAEKFKGYDPYDTLNSWFPFHWLGKWGKPIGIQIQKRNPINIRSLIGIQKEYNPKAMGLLLHAYSIQYSSTPDHATKEKMDFLFNWLLENKSKGYQHYCWGYNFDWASSAKFIAAHSPTIVVSVFIAKGIIAYYQASKDVKGLEVLKSIGNFIEHDLPKSEDQSGICFSYSTIDKDCCYNASMLGSELFAFLYQETKEEHYKQLALTSADFVVDKQKEDGKWNYSIDIDSGKEREQVDFHQGYVIDSLAYVVKYIPSAKAKYELALKKGMEYYRSQFQENGQCYYRIPAKWPVEIHNQAQGIITFARMSEYDENHLNFSQQVANYTLSTMRSTKGYFYYKKYPWITIKIPFMRWSQAWMFLALNELKFALERK